MTSVRLKVGKTTVRTTGYPSEANFVAQVNTAMKEVRQNMMSIIDQFEDATPDLLMEVLQPIFDESQVLVPEATGRLKNSGYIEVTSFRGIPTVEIGYAKGGNPDYAVYIHEMIEIPHRPPTQAKFLEKPLNDHMGSLADDIASAYKRFAGL